MSRKDLTFTLGLTIFMGVLWMLGELVMGLWVAVLPKHHIIWTVIIVVITLAVSVWHSMKADESGLVDSKKENEDNLQYFLNNENYKVEMVSIKEYLPEERLDIMNYPNYYGMQNRMPNYNYQPEQPINWVSGEVGAKAYPMAPNSTAILMDSESNVFYIKSTDGAGMPTLKAYDYTERVSVPISATQNIPTDTFATKEDLKEIWAKFEAIEAKQKPRTTAKKEADE